jgi:uncharacterized damage-inducible protein DinB
MNRSSSNSSGSSQRALDLSRRFATANEAAIAFVQTLSDDEWRSPCVREGRTVGQVVEHIAAGHLVIGGIIEAMAFGRPLPVAARRTAQTGARFNARQAAGFTGHSRRQGLRALRRNGRAIERFLATLSDEQLARTTDTIEGPVTTEREIEDGLFHHLSVHFEAVRESVGRAPQTSTASHA